MNMLAEYLAFARDHPERFVNPAQGGFTILLEEDDIRKVEASMAQRLQAKGLPTEWAQVGIVYQEQYSMILRDAVRFPGGVLGTYIRFVGNMDSGPSVIVLPLYQKQVLLVRRFRHATRTWHLEIPIEFGVKGLSGEENAHKELAREIGATISRLIPIGKLEEGPGSIRNPAELFLAHIEAYGDGNKTEIIPVTLTEFEQMIRESVITDSFTIITFLYAKLHGLL